MRRGIHHIATVEQADTLRRESEAHAYACGRWDERPLFGLSPLPAPSVFVREVLARDVRLIGFRALWDEMAAAVESGKAVPA